MSWIRSVFGTHGRLLPEICACVLLGSVHGQARVCRSSVDAPSLRVEATDDEAIGHVQLELVLLELPAGVELVQIHNVQRARLYHSIQESEKQNNPDNKHSKEGAVEKTTAGGVRTRVSKSSHLMVTEFPTGVPMRSW